MFILVLWFSLNFFSIISFYPKISFNRACKHCCKSICTYSGYGETVGSFAKYCLCFAPDDFIFLVLNQFNFLFLQWQYFHDKIIDACKAHGYDSLAPSSDTFVKKQTFSLPLQEPKRENALYTQFFIIFWLPHPFQWLSSFGLLTFRLRFRLRSPRSYKYSKIKNHGKDRSGYIIFISLESY